MAGVSSERVGDHLVVKLSGPCNIHEAGHLDRLLNDILPEPAIGVHIDLAGIDSLDTAGAWVVHRNAVRLRGTGHAVRMVHSKPAIKTLLDLVAANDRPLEEPPPDETALVAVIAHVGQATVEIAIEARNLVNFLGLTTLALARSIADPRRIRWTALFSHMEQAGLNAVPIVGLISFLVGAVLAYQGADQLRRFGAEIYVVNLIGVTMLREIAILLTAIIVAGRSGSAFTAAIGSMKVGEEIDAMRTIGLDPMEILVLPRLVGLVLTLPLLAFLADMMGLLGGALVAWIGLGISPGQFIERLSDAIPVWSFWIGIIKAPVFAALIAMVGCYEGFQVEGSAESVGRLTTKSVVEAIFLVIIADAVFSILFSYIGI